MIQYKLSMNETMSGLFVKIQAKSQACNLPCPKFLAVSIGAGITPLQELGFSIKGTKKFTISENPKADAA